MTDHVADTTWDLHGVPFNLYQWIADNRDLLRPPVCNKQLWVGSSMIVHVVGGGNQRTDYHDDACPELFYQLTGDMLLRIVDGPGEQPHDVHIREGDIYLLPPHVRHSPQRPDPQSVGLVVEYARPPGVPDGFEWYCFNCQQRVHRTEVMLTSIETDLPPIFEAFYASTADRTCWNCGTVHPGKAALAQ